MSAAVIDPNAVASSTPIRLPKAPLTATWIDPARPATSERTTATDVADTAARIPPGLGRAGQGGEAGRE